MASRPHLEAMRDAERVEVGMQPAVRGQQRIVEAAVEADRRRPRREREGGHNASIFRRGSSRSETRR